ncbi:MAG: ParB/RepB/Spo0J family partition protein [Bacteroidales bacterium]|nr:ParB/RepB/Spo0J family partition protein [Lentimicrobiaceae bacterium]MDD5694003.1 ParB/RepB/Spo0J family partition protein [Bacteroidales bacterium]
MKEKRRALGRGLDAILNVPDTLIASKDTTGHSAVGAVMNIRIESIESNPFQPRDSFEEASLRELAESIRALGIIQPLTVRSLGYNKYQLIVGERRLLAARQAGLQEVPAFIRVANDQEMLEMALVENIQRKELNPIQIAIGFQRLTEECNLTQDQLSQRVGKNRTTISNFIRLLKLPPEIQVALRNETITMGHARALINIEDADNQLNMYHVILEKNLSVRQVEQLVRDLRIPPNSKSKKRKPPLPQKFQDLQQSLAGKLSAKVGLQRNTKGKGLIVIAFDSDEDLERIISHIS